MTTNYCWDAGAAVSLILQMPSLWACATPLLQPLYHATTRQLFSGPRVQMLQYFLGGKVGRQQPPPFITWIYPAMNPSLKS